MNIPKLIDELVEATSFKALSDDKKPQEMSVTEWAGKHKKKQEREKKWITMKKATSWTLPLTFLFLIVSVCVVMWLIYKGIKIGGNYFWAYALGAAAVSLFMGRFSLIPLLYYYSKNKDRERKGIEELYLSVVNLSGLAIAAAIIPTVMYYTVVFISDKGLVEKALGLLNYRTIGGTLVVAMLIWFLLRLTGRKG